MINPIVISTGRSRKTRHWQKETITYPELIKKVSEPVVTDETFSDFLKLSTEDQDNLKDVGGFVGGNLKNGRRTKSNVLDRTIITLDADYLTSREDINRMTSKLDENDLQYVVYTTRKNTIEKPRARILIPLEEPIPEPAYEPIVRMMCKSFGMGFFDKTTVDSNRLMFWPSVSRDMLDQYYTTFNPIGSQVLNGLDFLKSHYTNWQDQREWPRFPGEKEIITNKAKVQEDPLEKEGLIGTFCRTYYPIQTAIEKFLPDLYEQVGEDRYTWVNGSTAAGAVVYNDGRFLYSNHDTDPAGETLCNAFDLVRIHKFGHLGKRQSETAMLEFAAKDEKVRQNKAKEEMAGINPDQDEIDLEELKKHQDLRSKLTRTNKGEVEATIENIRTILEEDPTLKGKYYYDLFAERYMVLEALPWDSPDQSYPRDWTDTDDDQFKNYLERAFKIYHLKKTEAGINVAFSNHSIHPIKEYLESLEWDGKERINTLLIDYFGAADNAFTRESVRTWLMAAVARIYEPGLKYDEMLILVGDEGIGKSTFFNRLGGKWFTDSLDQFKGKDAYETLQGSWIIEIGELASFRKHEMDEIRAFLSKETDKYRPPYGRRTATRGRQCVFAGTTNAATFLRDKNNRRYYPIQLGERPATKNVFINLKQSEVDQIWAEAYHAWQYMPISGESLILSPEAERLAQIARALREEADPREGMIIEFLKQKIPTNWDNYPLEERRLFWAQPVNDRLIDPITGMEIQLEKRKKICAAEIGHELFDFREGRLDRRSSMEFNKILDNLEGLEKDEKLSRYGTDYGRQRGYLITEEFFEKN